MHNVKDFGAVGDGITLDTAAIQRAIDAGGIVHFPAGTYLTGTLYLKSNGGLDLAPDAKILASSRIEDYNSEDFCPQNRASWDEASTGGHLIVAVEQENITISGSGTIDGHSEDFFDFEAFDMRPHWLIPGKRSDWYYRPGQMLFFCECDRVTIQNIRLYHSAFWACFLHGCTDVIIHGVRIDNHEHSWNTDGIDIDCCSRVTVSDCIIKTGDDCITLRGNEMPLKTKRACEYVTVTNCVLSSTTCAIRVGVGNGLIHSCLFSNLIIRNSIHGISINNRFFAKDSQGNFRKFCMVRNISFENIDIEAYFGISLVTDWFGEFSDPAGYLITENIAFRNLRITSKRTCNIIAQSDQCVHSITFSDCVLRFIGSGNESGIDRGCKVWGWDKPNALFHLQNVCDVEFYRI